MLITFFYLIYSIFIGFLSYIVPKNRYLYVFATENGTDFKGNGKALFLYLQKENKNIKIYYLTLNNEHIKKYNNFIYQYSFKGIILLLRAKFLFSGGGIKSFFPSYLILGRWNYINLWHGDAYKKIGYDNTKQKLNFISFLLFKKQQSYNNIVTVGSYFSQNSFKSAFLTNNVVITGLARNDIFFEKNKYMIIGNFYNNFNIYKYKKIYLYAPTWRDDKNFTPFSILFLNNLNKFLIKNNSLFFIKLHPNEYNSFDYKNLGNIIDITNYDCDIQEILYYTDVLISDYSSISIDFYLTNRPNIFYIYDHKIYYKSRDMYLKYDDIGIDSTTAYDEKSLFKIIRGLDTIVNNKKYVSLYKKQKTFWHKNTRGGFCENILKQVDRLL